jgi:D-alanyl-lipoteichoic acid acyltransferase DltB (MBOAT superfamily)
VVRTTGLRANEAALVELAQPASYRDMPIPLAHPIFAFGLPHGSEWIFIAVLFLLGPVLWISALVSCIKNESATDNTKAVWVIIIVVLQGFGALAYFLIRRPQRIRELGR